MTDNSRKRAPHNGLRLVLYRFEASEHQEGHCRMRWPSCATLDEGHKGTHWLSELADVAMGSCVAKLGAGLQLAPALRGTSLRGPPLGPASVATTLHHTSLHQPVHARSLCSRATTRAAQRRSRAGFSLTARVSPLLFLKLRRWKRMRVRLAEPQHARCPALHSLRPQRHRLALTGLFRTGHSTRAAQPYQELRLGQLEHAG